MLIVYLNITGFGDDKTIHRLFIQYLTETLGEFIVPSSLNWDSTLNNVSAHNVDRYPAD